MATDPKTGDILTMAGSRNYFDTEIDGAYNIALANRQPGSAFKPFIYSQAFLDGYTPDTVLFDVPTQFSTACAPSDMSDTPPCYSPSDYDGDFVGPITIRNALAQSRNVPAVEALYLVGINPALSLAKSMGITTLGTADQYGLTLVLGGGEVSLLDMTSAYGVFANGGVRNPYRSILRIEDASGNIVKQYPTDPEPVLDQNVALTMTDVLADNVARTPELGAASPLYFPGREVAAKTGTTNDYRDAWILGYTPDISVGAWAGNNDDSPMQKKIAGFIVAPLWNAFMQYALTKFPNDPFPQAPSMVNDSLKPVLRGIWQGGTTTLVDTSTLQPVPDGFMGPTKDKITEAVHSILYWVDKTNPQGPPPANPADRPAVLPLGIQCAPLGRTTWLRRRCDDIPVRKLTDIAHGLTGFREFEVKLSKDFAAHRADGAFGDRGTVDERDPARDGYIFFRGGDAGNIMDGLGDRGAHGFVGRRE